MIRFIKKNLFILAIIFAVLFFFQKTIISGLLPIPSDTIVGLYHPYRDFYAKDYPRGIPFKNFLITDPVRQTIPWKSLSIDNLSRFELPLWNPYEMAGKPLLGNFQSSPFYPLNLILLVKPFEISWSLFIMIQPLLAGLFLFAYLKNLKLDNRASLFGAVSFAFGGFSIAWLEWGNVVHTALWLPLILLSIDKLVSSPDDSFHSGSRTNEIRRDSKYPVFSIKNRWSLVLVFALVSSFFAGHLQIFFYLYILSITYFLFRFFEHGKSIKRLLSFVILNSLFIILTSIQWYPTLQFINLSARSIDQNPLTTAGWFIPWQNLVQFVAPDLFGNPATLNYWGVWNYGEFIGYIGIISLFLAACSLLSKHKKEVIFFFGAIIVCLLFSLPTPVARLPFDFSIPFLSSAQPTRLVFLMTFCLSVLAGFGFNYLISHERVIKKSIVVIIMIFVLLFAGLFAIALGLVNNNINPNDLLVAKRNLIFPSGIFAAGIILVFGVVVTKNLKLKNLLIAAILVLSFYDLYRFGTKFTPFTEGKYFYPSTKVIEFLQKDKSVLRIASTDSRILPPNFSTYYKIQSIEGYDPLYLKSYAELIAASERSDHSIKPPFGFNRIITPHKIDSPIIDLLNVKYVLSFSDLKQPKFVKVFQEGQTKVYENKNHLPRAFFVNKVIRVEGSKPVIETMFINDLKTNAVVAGYDSEITDFTTGIVKIEEYFENKVAIQTINNGDGFLVLTDSYYPTWKAEIDGKSVKIYKTDHAFRGIFVSKGEHKITFYDTLF